MKPFKSSALIAAAVVVALAGCAHQGPQSTSPAASAASQQAAPQVTRQALATALYELAYSARQDAVFVASAGGFGPDAPASRVLRLDPDTLAVQAEIALERKGFGIALDDAANRLYVGNAVDASITVIDTAANKVVGVVQLAQKAKTTGQDGKEVERYPHNFRELVLDKAGHRLYAPGRGSDSALYVVDTRALKVEKVIPGLGVQATGIALDERAGKVYVTNLRGQLYTIDTRTLTLAREAEVAANSLLNLVLDNKRGHLLGTYPAVRVTAELKQRGFQSRGAGNSVIAIDPADGRVLNAAPTGEGPVALLLDEARGRLYVTNRGTGTVTVFDASDYRWLQTIDLPSHPNSLALDARRNVLYVSVKNGEKDPKGSSESVARIQF